MKKITFPVVLFLLAACSSNNESRQTEETVATVVTVDVRGSEKHFFVAG